MLTRRLPATVETNERLSVAFTEKLLALKLA